MTRLCIALLLAAGAEMASAQVLDDPTRPPPQLGALRADGAAVASAGPQLQSVLVARQPGGRHVAVIDGDTVRVGDLWKGARVARIGLHEVELVRGKERQLLKLDSPAIAQPNE